MRYRYEIDGTAAGGQTWHTSGTVDGVAPGDVYDVVMRRSFMLLAEGKAVYGQPGVGCQGPYNFKRILIEAEGEP